MAAIAGSKCTILARQNKFNDHCCMRCCSPFAFLINTKRQCLDCKFNVCKSCSSYSKEEKAWICAVCQTSSYLVDFEYKIIMIIFGSR
ncbi:rab effector MyRIP-like [Polyodon spathula]|uniref:rab effector MyRIP-like n=1 Tax=Polyodon spathula TaxID=7913 RepID=UPI001B7E2D92|nr:rab effector MyRIP-like [Polyodon spathula]